MYCWDVNNGIVLFILIIVIIIEKSSTDTRPWFYYLAFPQVHTPEHSSRFFANSSNAGKYGDMIEEVDCKEGGG